MTDHPLTDEICDTIQDSIHPCDPADMRAAADWQLEQVINWMRHSSESLVHRDWYLEAIGHCGAEMGIDLVIEELREAMRPTTTTQENN